jgi:hypothetical protein
MAKVTSRPIEHAHHGKDYNMPMSHDDPPETAPEVPTQLLEFLKAIQSSPYVAHCQQLTPYVAGRVVVGTEAGTSGFALLLDDGSWVISALEQSEWRWRRGDGAIPESELALISSSEYGDASEPLSDGSPYGDRACDLASEVAKCVGQSIEQLAFGERAFDFCFPGGRELDVRVCLDKRGRLAYRVYWEQW